MATKKVAKKAAKRGRPRKEATDPDSDSAEKTRSITLPNLLWRYLTEDAAKNKRSVNKQIEWLLEPEFTQKKARERAQESGKNNG